MPAGMEQNREDPDPPLRRCSTGHLAPREAFASCAKNGRQRKCRECQRRYMQQWKQARKAAKEAR
jgi:hypothetical protein